METDDLKELALSQCVDIYHDYDESEVNKFAPPSVQKAWEIGQKAAEIYRKQLSKKLKNFTI